MSATYSFTGEVYEYPGTGAWHFVNLPEAAADEIEDLTRDTRRGFGSVRVEVTIGKTTWQTSIFPDTKAGTYLLPVKKPVRRAEGLADGSKAKIKLRLIET